MVFCASRGRTTSAAKRSRMISTSSSRHRLVTSRAMIAPAPATPAITAVAASVPSAVERSKAAAIHQ